MVTPLNAPKEIRVMANDHGSPTVVWLKGKQRKVARVRNVWRVDDEWWRQEICRRYFELEMSNGSVATIFQDLVSGDWYQQRY